MLSKDIFDPNYGLFKLSSNKVSIYPSPLSFLIPNQLQEFRMAGRLLGKALIENWNIEVTFAKSFLKHILGHDLYINDLEDIDYDMAK